MRLIDADAIGLNDFEIILCDGSYKEALKMLLNKIETAPTVEERKTGAWEDCGAYADMLAGRVHQCSICGAKFSMANERYTYCPNCGSKMEETYESE